MLYYNQKEGEKPPKEKEVKKMKVWGFNCYGVCVAYIDVNKIDRYNEKHPLVSEKIVSWKE